MALDQFSVVFLPVIQTPVIGDLAVVPNKNSRRNSQKLSRAEYEETQLMWRFFRFLGPAQEEEMDGFRQGAANELANGLSSEFFLSALNRLDSLNGYYPEQQDCLYINLHYRHPEKHKKSRPYIGAYLAFIFDQQWKIETGYGGLRFRYEQLMEGYIEIK